MSGGIGRRGLVASGALGSGLVLLARISPAHAGLHAAEPEMPAAAGTVGLWTRFNCQGGARLRLAQLDAAMRPTGTLASATLGPEQVASMAQVHAAARGFAVAAVARSWNVSPAHCHSDGALIRDRASGRSVRCLQWMDFD